MKSLSIDDLLKISNKLDQQKEKTKEELTPLMRKFFNCFGADFDKGDKLILKQTSLFVDFVNSIHWLFGDRVGIDKYNLFPLGVNFVVINHEEQIKPIKFEAPILIKTPNPIINLNLCS